MARRSRALLVALALLGACIARAQQNVIAAEQSDSHFRPLLTDLHSSACLLAGGWCPLSSMAQQPAAGNGGPPGSGPDASQPPKGHHKPLLPLSPLDVLAFTIAGLALLLAASGGIGGGGILVPLYLLILGFSTSGAVALSNITIMGGTLANLAFNIGKAHPLRPGAPLIDWDLILVMEPSTILGAILGGYVNKVLPGWLTTLSLSVLLSYVTYKLAAKAADIRRKERRAVQHTLAGLSAADGEAGDLIHSLTQPLLGEEEEEHGQGQEEGGDSSKVSGDGQRPLSPASPFGLRPDSAGTSSGLLDAGEQGEQEGLEAVDIVVTDAGGGGSSNQDGLALGAGEGSPHASLRDQLGPGKVLVVNNWRSPSAPSKAAPEAGAAATCCAAGGSKQHPAAVRPAWRPHLPLTPFAVLVALLAGVIATDISKHYVPCPSLAYWSRATAMVPITLAVLLAVRAFLLRKNQEQREAGHQAVEGDVEWTPKTTLLYPALCSFAGIAAGTFGVGGGIIKGPLMLEMGVLPEVAAATSATMILFTSLSASVVFISFGVVQWDYAAVLLVLGVVSTTAGQLLVQWMSRHVKSRSLIVVIMAIVLGLSSVALGVQGVLATHAAAAAHDLWHFNGICGSSSA